MLKLSPLILVAIASGGALGAISRYLIQLLFNNDTFPWGTLLANVSGCLIIGLVIGYWSNTGLNVSAELKAFLTIGFLGAFTTFSAFSLDTITFMQNAEYLRAVMNISLNLFLCLLGTILGFMLAKSFS